MKKNLLGKWILFSFVLCLVSLTCVGANAQTKDPVSGAVFLDDSDVTIDPVSGIGYYYVSDPKDFLSAQDWDQTKFLYKSIAGQLLIISDAQENDFVTKFLAGRSSFLNMAMSYRSTGDPYDYPRLEPQQRWQWGDLRYTTGTCTLHTFWSEDRTEIVSRTTTCETPPNVYTNWLDGKVPELPFSNYRDLVPAIIDKSGFWQPQEAPWTYCPRIWDWCYDYQNSKLPFVLMFPGAMVRPPSAPQISKVFPGKTQATLTIVPPTENNDTSPASYQISIDNGTSWNAIASSSGQFVVSGLKPNTTYSVLVRAVNSAGPGLPSNAVTVTPTDKTPSAPVIASVVPGDSKFIINIAPPTDMTAQTITSYEYNINDGRVWSPLNQVNGQYLVSGLVNGVKFAVKVRALNINGPSRESNRVSATPVTIPSSPTIVSTTASSGSLTVQFSDPKDNGGSTITNYQYSLDGGSSWQTVAPAIKRGPKLTVKGLTNGQTYSVMIRAMNAVGLGAASNAVSTTVVGPPAAIIGSNISVSRTSVSITFGLANNGGSPITSYNYSTNNKVWTTAPAGSPVTITGLRPETVYAVYLRADNNQGKGVVTTITYKTLK